MRHRLLRYTKFERYFLAATSRPCSSVAASDAPRHAYIQGYQDLNSLSVEGMLDGDLVRVTVSPAIAFLMQSCDIGEPDSSTVDMTVGCCPPLMPPRPSPLPSAACCSLSEP